MSNGWRASLIWMSSVIWAFPLMGALPIKAGATSAQIYTLWGFLAVIIALPMIALAPWRDER